MEAPARVRKASVLLLPIIYLGFISIGLPDGTLGVAWPEIYPELGLPIGIAGMLTLVGTILAALGGFNSGRIIARFQTGPVIMVSCALTGAGLLMISQAPGLSWLLVASLLLGFGAGAVDAGLNGFVARHYSGRHMNWLHACWGLGAMCGPLLMGYSLNTDSGWRGGYLIIGLIQFGLVVLFVATLPLWSTVPERREAATHEGIEGRASLLPANSFAGFLSAGIFALYVAVEATIGLWAATVLVVGRSMAPATAAVCAAGYYGSIMAGRILAGVMVERTGNRVLTRFGGLLALAGSVLFCFSGTAPLAMLALAMVGLGFAPIYPCLMHEVPQRFAPDAVQTVIGRQSGTACLGGATMPALAGLVAQKSVTTIPWIAVAGIVVLIVSIRVLDRRS
ncbi:MAG TPA: MFS transporter [Opitutaceae bacterium]|nr:MFS transporter [Opitutaceae bacterium]